MKLLTPVKIGTTTVKNRAVSTAHGAFFDFYSPQSDGERYIAYLERRAQGGTGLVILSAMQVHYSSQKQGQPLYQRDDIIEKYQRLAKAMQPHGCMAVQQLFHRGAEGKSDGRDDVNPLWSMSGTVSAAGEASHEMTADEIEEVIQGFVDASTAVVEGGLDGVELHATHGYLLIQSLSPWANRRTDEWGDPYRLITTVARRVRAAIGPDRIMGLRLSADDFKSPENGGLGRARLCEIAAHLVSLGLFDYLNHSEGSGGADYARAIGSFRHRFGEFLPLTRGLRDAIGGRIPVIGVGKIPTPDLAEQALQNGDCDLVGMTRAQIADPDLVKKLSEGKGHLIRMCTGSNQGCVDRMSNLQPISCFQNPEVGMERKLRLEMVKVPDDVLIIGGGPAGMKAAELAARRGYTVTLVEKSARLGGWLNHVEHLTHASNLLSSISWLEQELLRHRINLKLQTTVDERFIADSKAKQVILATGAEAVTDLSIACDDSVPVISTDEAAQGCLNGVKFDMKGTRSLVLDLRGNLEVALVIEELIKQGSKVTVLTPFLSYGPNLGASHMVDLMGFFLKNDCEIKTTTSITGVRDGCVFYSNSLSGKEASHHVDFVVAGVHPRPNKHLYQVLRKKWPSVLVAGDVVAPRPALEAFREGDRAGRSLH